MVLHKQPYIPMDILNMFNKNFISKAQHEKELNKLSNNLSRGINRESLKFKDYKQKVLDLIDKWWEKNHSDMFEAMNCGDRRSDDIIKELKQRIKRLNNVMCKM